MPDTEISALAAFAAFATGDLLVGVDVSDTTMGAGGTDKKLMLSQLFGALTGDVTFSGLAGTIAAAAVTYSKIQSVAASRLLGNPTSSPAAPSEITLGTNLSFSGTTLNAASGGAANPGGSANQIQFNNAGTAFGGFTLSGDATLVVGTGVITIATAAVTYSKIQAVGPSAVLGNPTGTPGVASEITLGSTLAFVGSALRTGAITGDVTAAANSFTTTIAAAAVTYSKIQSVAASRLLGNPTGSPASASEVSLGAGLSFSGTSVVATGPRMFTAVLGLGANIATGTNSTSNYLVCPFAGTFTRWDMVCPTANQPSGASLVVDVMKSAAGAGSFASLWGTNPSNRPTITTATNNGGGTSFDTTTFNAGDVLRFDVITAGGGAVQNVTLTISSRMNQ